MKAIVYTHYVLPHALWFKKVATPAPTDDEVSIKL
jgi:NADPH:quinone reductase-like Zn-dependent oxidoreductase